MNKYSAKRMLVTEDGTMFELAELKKYNITDIEGIRFDSKMEAEYYLLLKDQLRKGIIQDIVLQPKFILQDGKRHERIEYKADFQVVYANGDVEVIDVKGMQTKDFKIKRKLFERTIEHKLKLVTRKGKQWVVM